MAFKGSLCSSAFICGFKSISEGLDSSTQFGGGLAVKFTRRRGSALGLQSLKINRRADAHFDARRARQRLALRQRLKCAFQKNWKDRRAELDAKHADAGFEGLQLARQRARAFGEEQDRAPL